MPTYLYRCQSDTCGIRQRAMNRISHRDSHPPVCTTCGGATARDNAGWSAGEVRPLMPGEAKSAPVVKEYGLLDPASGRRFRFVDRACTVEDCGHVEDTVEQWLDADGQPAEPEPTCSECGGAALWQDIDPGHSRFSEKFPYFCEGLNCWLKSKAHRKQVMAERGVEEAGDMRDTIARHMRAEDDEERRVFAKYNALRERYKHDPELRQVYGQLEDEGRGMMKL